MCEGQNEWEIPDYISLNFNEKLMRLYGYYIKSF